MSAFTGPLTITHIDVDWRMWLLERSLCYEVGFKGSGRTITVPQGFVTDGASVPRIFWAVLPQWGSYSRAAVIHDYLITRIKDGDPHPEAHTREIADRIFSEACVVCGTPIWLRWFLGFGVRMGTLVWRMKTMNLSYS